MFSRRSFGRVLSVTASLSGSGPPLGAGCRHSRRSRHHLRRRREGHDGSARHGSLANAPAIQADGRIVAVATSVGSRSEVRGRAIQHGRDPGYHLRRGRKGRDGLHPLYRRCYGSRSRPTGDRSGPEVRGSAVLIQSSRAGPLQHGRNAAGSSSSWGRCSSGTIRRSALLGIRSPVGVRACDRSPDVRIRIERRTRANVEGT
jgi:hypothetical protein